MNLKYMPNKERYLQIVSRRKLRTWVFCALAAAVAFCTLYIMMLPAATEEAETFCGIEEHVHTEECYGTVPMLTCEEAECAAHAHGEECYGPVCVLNCAVPETEGHTHNADCYGEETVYVCGQEETEGHAHSENCYSTESVYVCGLENDTEHIHDTACMTTVVRLVCTLEEKAPHSHAEECTELQSVLRCSLEECEPHFHTDACYEETMGLICTLAETEGHVHSDACYAETEQVLICTLEEHTHNRICFSNPSADLESNEVWSRSTSPVTLTGNRGEDLVKIAETQLGKAESTANYIVNEDGTISGITRYGQWAGTPYGEWNAYFVSFCLNYAKISTQVFPRNSEPAEWAKELQQCGLYQTAEPDALQTGNLVFIDADSDNVIDRVGIIASITADENGNVTAIKVIEGDVQGTVARVTYSALDAKIKGIGLLPENPAMETENSAEKTEVTHDVTKTQNDLSAAVENNDNEAEKQGEVNAVEGNTSIEQVIAMFTALPDFDTFIALPSEEKQNAISAAAVAYEEYCALSEEEQVTIDEEILDRAITILALASEESAFLAEESEEIVENTSFDTATEIYLGASIPTQIKTAGEKRYFVITPTKSGDYTCISSGAYDTVGYLYDANGKQLTFNDDGAGYGQFSITYFLTAGKTYYYAVRLFSSSKTSGSFSIKLTGVVDPDWSVSEDGVLTIYSSSKMPNYPSASVTPWYSKSNNITAIVIEDGLQNIGNYAFASLSKVQTIQLPDSVKTIGKYAFYSDSQLTGIEIPEGMTSIGEYTFYGCNALTGIEIPAAVKTIGAYAFYNCAGITELSLPDGLTKIDSYAFYGCRGLTEITVPDSVTSMGSNVFSNCTNLSSVTLSTGMSGIPTSTFFACSSLTSIEIPENYTSIGNYAFGRCGFTEFTVPETITSLGTNVFNGCTKLKSATLPEHLTSIPSSTFYECSALESFEISGNVTKIGSYAFSGCKQLQEITIPDSVTTIESYAFRDCDSLTEVILPNSVTSIGMCCFYDCDALETVELSSNMTTIPEKAFYSCDSLSDCPIPANITTVEKNAFQDCGSLKTLTIEEGLTTIENEAFRNCDGLTEVTLPNSVTSLGTGVFYDCDNLITVTLSENVEVIPNSTFYSCDKLESCVLPDSVTEIGDFAFYGCTSLKEFTTSEGVETIGTSAFSGCTSLREFTVSDSVTTIGASAFSGDTSLKMLTIDAENLSSVDVTAFSTCSKMNSIVIGSNVDTISPSLVTAIEKIPATQKELSFAGPNTFTLESGLDNLVGYPMPAGLYYADELGNVYLLDEESHTAKLAYVPSGTTEYTAPATVGMNSEYAVTEIGNRVFEGNANLTSVTIPDTMTKIGDAAFRDCVNLTSFNGETSVAGAKETLPDTVFGGFSLENTGLEATPLEPDGTESNVGDGEDFDTSAVQVKISTETGKYKEEKVENNTLMYYTGETARTTISVSNPDSSAYPPGTIVRVYFRFDDSKGKIDYTPGNYTFVNSESGNSYPYTVGTTTVPNCYYIDIPRPEQGETISLTICSSYPSPTSGGGTEKIWCSILDEAAHNELGSGVTEPEQYQRLSWDTKADTFPVTKKASSSSTLTLTGDGKENGMATVSEMAYTITYNRQGDTLYVGKDYMKSIDFVDVLTLPEGFTYSDSVLTAIETGKYTVSRHYSGYGYEYYAGGVKICYVKGTTYGMVDAGTLTVEETEDGRLQLIVSWKSYSSGSSTEMSSNSISITYYNIQVPQSQLEANQKYTFHNEVDAVEHFNYSEDQYGSASAEKSLTVAAANPSLNKQYSGTQSHHYGDSVPFTLILENKTALPCSIISLDDNEMPNSYYIPASGIQRLFTTAKEDEEVTITIENATLCSPDSIQSVTGVDGNTYTTSINDTWSQSAHRGINKVNGASYTTESATIVLNQKAGSSLITMTIDGTEVGTIGEGGAYSSIEQALNAYHYKVTYNDRYKISWKYNDGTLLYGGQKRTYVLQTVFKDTFMMLTSDQEYSYQGKALSSSMEIPWNKAVLTYGDDKKIKASSGYRPAIDFTITKGYVVNGQISDTLASVSDGETVDYSVTFKHAGTAVYQELPLVDHMMGSQVLLVPVELNNTTAWATGCDIYTDENGNQYYMLSNAGTYSHVNVGGYLADRVVVTASGQGTCDTLIYWYFNDITGTISRTVNYKALVCPSKLGLNKSTLAFSVGNEAWLGDYQGHRIYAPVGEVGGVVFTMDKSIVDETSETAALIYGTLSDWDYTQYTPVPGYDYCRVSEGETVVYRLRLKTVTDDTTVTLRGGNEFQGDLWDYLPAVTDNTSWTKSNVSICYNGFDAVSDTSASAWSIVMNDSGEQIITWNSDFYLTFSGTGDIYVTVQFPKNTETKTLWDEYARAYGATTLINTFKVLNVTDSVTHDLVAPAEVRLQKGVAYTGQIYYQSDSLTDYSRMITNSGEMSRWYYGNNDRCRYYVMYYASLCNEGVTNLYLTELTDVLPRGFTYKDIYYNGSVVVVKDPDDTLTRLELAVSATTETNEATGVQTIHFNLAKSSTAAASKTLSYDKNLGMYYLKPGQYIAFAYMVFTNETDATDEEALNSISMPYFDHNGGGVTVGNSSSTYNFNAEPNDGGCEVIDNGTAESMGLSGGNNSTQWLTSNVTVYRGNIQPGITKGCYSATSTSGTTTVAPTAASPTDKITWRIIAQNNGYNKLEDFVITDVMEYPYTFTGAVSYELYAGKVYSSNQLMLYNSSLFTITENNGTTATIVSKIYRTSSNVYTTVQIGAEDYTWFTAWAQNKLVNSGTVGGPQLNIGIRLYYDENGNQVMMLRFKDSVAAIPSGGYMYLGYSTKNETNTAQNHTYVNDVYITPLIQTWDHTVSQGNYTEIDLSNEGTALPSVKSQSQITVATGYATTSVKKIEEVGNPNNSALSTSTKNYIFLDDNSNLFTYTLSVSNTTSKGMDQLILIDNLPEPGDHSTFTDTDLRESDFKVSFADEPAFKVVVTELNGTVTVLNPSDYLIEFSTKTEFSKQDWNGTETDGWIALADADANTIANARSFRMILLDDSGTKIPAQATFAICFNARIDDESAKPAEIAWNSFGYHYSLVDVSYSLEAAPRKVGILIPSVPAVEKSLRYETGTDFIAEEDMTFRYILYSGAMVDLSDCTTDAERYSKLTAAKRQIAYLERTVLANESASESLSLENLQVAIYDSESGWTTVADSEFAFVNGNNYTLYEIPENADFTFRSGTINGANNAVRSSGLSFTYNVRTNQNIMAINTRNTWKLTVTKTDERNSTILLENAVFGLYSVKETDRLTQEAAGDYPQTIIDNGVTYYLCGIYKTDSKGKFTADNLFWDVYLLKELQAPENYDLNETVFTINRADDYSEVRTTVMDKLTQYELPMTGGMGTKRFIQLGVLLISATIAILMYREKKKKEEESASL